MKAEMFLMRGLMMVCAAALLIGFAAMLLTRVPMAPAHFAQSSHVAQSTSVNAPVAACAKAAAVMPCQEAAD